MLLLIAMVGCEWLETDPLDVPYESPTTRAVEGPTKSRDGIALPEDRGRLTTDPTTIGDDAAPVEAGQATKRWQPVRVPKAGEVEDRRDLTRVRTTLKSSDGRVINVGRVADRHQSSLEQELSNARSAEQAKEIQIEIDTTNGTFRHEP